MEKSESKNTYPKSTSEALSKIYRYCAYQDRSHREVKNKLFEYGLRSNQVDEILSQLISEGFLNEERFAKSFVGGKFRMLKWGKVKIKRELEQAGLTPRCIKSGLAEIDQTNYLITLKSLIKKKSSQLDAEGPRIKKGKIARYVIGKGYETDLVWGMLNEIFN
ncbi:MAG: RecX family transcriptional regulator [Bacteroidetes bacterium]|nr:RecX family transcriptional regulator [Bacteroidota bacterium]